MKQLFTIIIFFISFSLFSQVRLDSISYLEDEEVEPFYIFKYDNQGRLVEYFDDVNETSAIIEYDGDEIVSFLRFDSNDQELIGEYEIFYIDGLIDSVLVSKDGDQISIRFSYDLGVLKSIEWFGKDGNMLEPIFRKDFSYNLDGLLDTMSIYSFEESADVFFETFKYDNNGRKDELTQYYSGEYDSRTTKNYSYNINETVSSLAVLEYYNGDIEDTLWFNYQYDVEIDFNAVIGPKPFMSIFKQVVILDLFMDYILAGFSEKKVINIDLSYGDEKFAALNHFYSMFVSTEDTYLPASPIKIYPNPTSDYIQINSNTPIREYSIFTREGRLIEHKVNHDDSTINVQQFSSGWYTLTATTSGGIHHFGHFVVE